MIYLKSIMWTFIAFCSLPYTILGIYYAYLIGYQAMGPWVGFIASGLFISIGVVPLIIWVILKIKRYFDE